MMDILSRGKPLILDVRQSGSVPTGVRLRSRSHHSWQRARHQSRAPLTYLTQDVESTAMALPHIAQWVDHVRRRPNAFRPAYEPTGVVANLGHDDRPWRTARDNRGHL